MKKLNQQGYNLVELLIAVGILSVLASSVMVARSYMAKQTVKAEDKAYASQKAIQMFEELKALVNGSEQLGVAVLDQYSDGLSYNTVLTTDKLVDTGLTGANPYDPLSGNKLTNGHNRYVRQVQVNRVANDPWTRQVIIKVWEYGSDGAPTQPGPLLSTVGGYLRTISNVQPPTQVMDLYCLALSNVLGWFTTIPSMGADFQNIANDIHSRNPGLELRQHYITQTGYGRDPYYRPSINVAQAATSVTSYSVNNAPSPPVTTVTGLVAIADMPWVYFYPGLCAQDGSADPPFSAAMFFDNNELQAAGNINADGAQMNSPYNTSLCDMYNADVRYPDAVSLYGAITLSAAASLTSRNIAIRPENLPAPTLRMVLEQMNDTQNYRNALLISMHGEVLPLPNIRNYSDPAKDPVNNPYVRAVAHPELIHNPYNVPVSLRVYSYYDGLIDPSGLDTSGATTFGNRAATISLYFPKLNLIPSDLGVTAVIGGIDAGPATTAYAYQNLTVGVTVYSMAWTITHPTAGVDTLLTLYNSPLRCPEVVTGGNTTGLNQNSQLYSCEYIPCPVDGNFNYATDLTTHNVTARNTARWIIALNKVNSAIIPEGQYAVETRIGGDITTGTVTSPPNNEESNVSRTYIWIGKGTTGATVGTAACGITPWTERYQFNGDPRFCPYQDVKFGSLALGTQDVSVTIDSNSYNWYFKNFNGSDGYSGFVQTASGYNIEDMRDMPKYYYIYRRGLLNNTAIYGNLNGYSFWHASEGGEIGSTYFPFSNSLQFESKPWDPGVANAPISIDEIQDNNNYVSTAGAGDARGIMRYVPTNSTSPYTNWYARPWQGELCPDDWFNVEWLPFGNLPTGITGFWRVPYQSMSPSPATGFLDGMDTRNYQWGIGGTGPTAFMNGWTATGTNNGFKHTTTGGTATATTLADNTYNITNFPLESPLVSSRPWAFDYPVGANGTLEWQNSFYDDETNGRRTVLSLPSVGGVNRIFYDSSVTGANWNTSGVVQMSIASPSNQTCYFTFSGLAPQGNYDPTALGKITLSMLIRTFLDGGNYSGVSHIPQIPLVKLYVNSPNAQYPYPNSNTYSVAITLTSPVTLSNGTAISNIWYRYPGISSTIGNFYTEEYPGYTSSAPLTASTYTESAAASLWVNFKWSSDNTNWFYLSDNAPATVGVYDGTVAGRGVTVASNAPITTTWDVSNATTFPQGNYWIRGEVYRPNYPLHYAYHELNISVNR